MELKPVIDDSTDEHLMQGFIIDKTRYSVMKSKSDKADVEVFFTKYRQLKSGAFSCKRVIRKVRGVIYKLNNEGIVQEELFWPLLLWNEDGVVEMHAKQKDLADAAIQIYFSLGKGEKE